MYILCEEGVASMHVSLCKEGVAALSISVKGVWFLFAFFKEGGMAFLIISHSKRGVAAVPITSFVKKVWPQCMILSKGGVASVSMSLKKGEVVFL